MNQITRSVSPNECHNSWLDIRAEPVRAIAVRRTDPQRWPTIPTLPLLLIQFSVGCAERALIFGSITEMFGLINGINIHVKRFTIICVILLKLLIKGICYSKSFHIVLNIKIQAISRQVFNANAFWTHFCQTFLMRESVVEYSKEPTQRQSRGRAESAFGKRKVSLILVMKRKLIIRRNDVKSSNWFSLRFITICSQFVFAYNRCLI